MDSILTATGVDAWTSGSRKLVDEFTTVLIDTLRSAKITAFAEDAQNQALPANGTGLTITATKQDTSLVKKGKFATEKFLATQLAIDVPMQACVGAAAANDTNPLISDLVEFNERAWFSLFFTAGNDPLDSGRVIDFPYNRAFVGMASTTAALADTIALKLVSNGVAGAERRYLRTPYRCTKDTEARLEIEFLQGAIAASVDFYIRPHIIGVEGL